MTELPANPYKWTPENVADWTASLNQTFTPEANVLRENLVNGEDLLEITDAQLKLLGIKSTLRRMKIMKNVNKLREESARTAESAAESNPAPPPKKARRDPAKSRTSKPAHNRAKSLGTGLTKRSSKTTSRAGKLSRSNPATSNASKKKISEEDFSAFMKHCGCKASDRELKKFFKDMDSRREGSILMRDLKRALLRNKNSKIKKVVTRDNVEDLYAEFCGEGEAQSAGEEEEAGELEEPPKRMKKQTPKQRSAMTNVDVKNRKSARPAMMKMQSPKAASDRLVDPSPEVEDILQIDQLECDILNKNSLIEQQRMRIAELETMVERSRADYLQTKLDMQSSIKAVQDSMDISEDTHAKFEAAQSEVDTWMGKYEILENTIADKEIEYQEQVKGLERQATHRSSQVETSHQELLNMSGALMDQLEESALELERVKSELGSREAELEQYRTEAEASVPDLSEVDDLRKKLEDANMEIEILKTSSEVSDRLQEKLNLAQAKLAELRIRQREELTSKDAQQKILELKEQIQELKSEGSLTESSMELEEARQEIHELKEKLAEFKKDPSAIPAPAACSDEVAILKQKLEEAEMEIEICKTAEDVADCLREELQQKDAEMSELRANSDGGEAKEQLDAAWKEIEVLQEQLKIAETVEDAAECMREELKLKDAEIAELREVLEQSEVSLDTVQELKEAQDEIKLLNTRLSTRIEGHKTEMSDVKAELFGTRQLVEDREVEVDILRDQVVTMRETIQEQTAATVDFSSPQSI